MRNLDAIDALIRRRSRAALYRSDAAECINLAASFTLQACVNARRARGGDAYAARYVASVKAQIRACLDAARCDRLIALEAGHVLP